MAKIKYIFGTNKNDTLLGKNNKKIISKALMAMTRFGVGKK
jgi:hypothetical protein